MQVSSQVVAFAAFALATFAFTTFVILLLAFVGTLFAVFRTMPNVAADAACMDARRSLAA